MSTVPRVVMSSATLTLNLNILSFIVVSFDAWNRGRNRLMALNMVVALFCVFRVGLNRLGVHST